MTVGRWMGAWVDLRFELRELIDFGDEVMAESWQQGRGRGSGVEVSEEIFSVWTLRAGKIVRQRMFRDRAQALEAAGAAGVGDVGGERGDHSRRFRRAQQGRRGRHESVLAPA
jgi:hypothetical protein